MPGGDLDSARLEQHQYVAHGLSWQATYVEALRQTLAWAGKLESGGLLGTAEAAMLRLGFAEYGQQLAGGIPMSQTEIARPPPRWAFRRRRWPNSRPNPPSRRCRTAPGWRTPGGRWWRN